MISVSVVEDRAEIRESLTRNINCTDGMTCISDYATGEEALEKLPRDKPDLVLMDIGLPKMSGVECLIRIALVAPEINFLMFTVFEEEELVFEALKAGAVGYVLKSEGVKGAILAIKEFKEGGAPMSRNIARKVLASFKKQNKSKEKTFEHLTKQQYIILEQLAEGLLNKEIADRLNIAERTVKQHNNSIYKKLQVNNRTEAVKKYLESRD